MTALKENLPGFVHLSMSEPMRNHNFQRLAWASFNNEHDFEQALEKASSITIDDFTLSATKSFPQKKKAPVRITPPLPDNNIGCDYLLAKELVTNVLDPEKGIESFIVAKLEETNLSE